MFTAGNWWKRYSAAVHKRHLLSEWNMRLFLFHEGIFSQSYNSVFASDFYTISFRLKRLMMHVWLVIKMPWLLLKCNILDFICLK